MLATIGVVGVTIPGATDCIQKMNQYFQDYFKPFQAPNIILHQPNFFPFHEAQEANRWDLIESYLLASLWFLKTAGADFAVIPANTAHKVIVPLQEHTPIPLIDMLEEVANECALLKYRRVGVLGTRWTMSDHLYQHPFLEKNMIEVVPSLEDQSIIQKAIFEELVPFGRVHQETLNKMLGVVTRLKNESCDVIALACTELPLVLNAENCGINVLDTTAILAKAAVKYAALESEVMV